MVAPDYSNWEIDILEGGSDAGNPSDNQNSGAWHCHTPANPNYGESVDLAGMS